MTIGERLRKARHAHHLSLQQVADRAQLSSATLSRIETSKQNLDLEVFLQLAEILNLHPADLLDQSRSDGNHSLAISYSSMNRQDRVGFWRDLIEASGNGRVNRRYSRKQIRNMALEIDELSAQIELVRETVEYLRKRLKNC